MAASPARDAFPKRERKSVEHFKPISEPKVAELVIAKGAGLKLNEIDNIVTRMSWVTRAEPMLKSLHRALFAGHHPKEATVKHNIGEFSGFVSDADADTASAKFEAMESATLSEVLGLLDLEVSGTKAEKVDRIIAFLKKPHATGRGEPTKGGKRRKSASGKKAGKKAAGKKAKRGTSSFMLFCADQRADVVKKNPSAAFSEIGKLLGEAWRAASEKVKEKYQQLAAEKNGKSAATASASGSDTDDDDEVRWW